MRISDWSSDVGSSDLPLARPDRDVVYKKVRRRCGVAEVKEPHVDRPEAFVDGLERPKAFRTGFELEFPGSGAGGGRREQRPERRGGEQRATGEYFHRMSPPARKSVG